MRLIISLLKGWVREHTRPSKNGPVTVHAYYDKRTKKAEAPTVRRKARAADSGGDAGQAKHEDLKGHIKAIADAIRAIESGKHDINLKGHSNEEAVANLKHQLKHKLAEIQQHGVDKRGKLTPEEAKSGLHRKSGPMQKLASGKDLHASFEERDKHADFSVTDHMEAARIHQDLSAKALKLHHASDAARHTSEAKKHLDASASSGAQETMHKLEAIEKKTKAKKPKPPVVKPPKKVVEPPTPPPPPPVKKEEKQKKELKLKKEEKGRKMPKLTTTQGTMLQHMTKYGQNKATLSGLQQKMGMRASDISRSMNVLVKHGLVKSGLDGYTITSDGMAVAVFGKQGGTEKKVVTEKPKSALDIQPHEAPNIQTIEYKMELLRKEQAGAAPYGSKRKRLTNEIAAWQAEWDKRKKENYQKRDEIFEREMNGTHYERHRSQIHVVDVHDREQRAAIDAFNSLPAHVVDMAISSHPYIDDKIAQDLRKHDIYIGRGDVVGLDDGERMFGSREHAPTKWDSRTSWTQTGGVYMLAEKKILAGDRNGPTAGTLLHEIGHSVGFHYINNNNRKPDQPFRIRFQEHPEFIAAHNKVVHRLAPYYNNPTTEGLDRVSTSGQHESFAECFNLTHTNPGRAAEQFGQDMVDFMHRYVFRSLENKP